MTLEVAIVTAAALLTFGMSFAGACIGVGLSHIRLNAPATHVPYSYKVKIEK